MGKIHAGTSGWAYSSWKPDFYPAKLASAKFLEHYATRLNSVEVNYTFRAQVTEKLLAGWIAATPVDFKFAVKVHQSITHIKRLRSAAKLMSDFLASLEPLREAGKLGPVLVQLPPNFKCDVGRLEEFLEGLPRGARVAIEFRHPSWFADDVYARLRRGDVALCWAESEDLETPDVATAGFSYFRLRKEKYSRRARTAVKERVHKAARRGEVFAYFKHEDTPDGAFYAEALLRNSDK
ncbi:MAG TPA: DUF72 domain-containing protein [Candidatus Acidoferrum sp.]|nr:DUF72 domain-containing protein [Candidatus Acidoferrum sp.]